MVRVVFVGLDKAVKDLSKPEFNRRVTRGFQAAGTIVEAEAKRIVQPHHFTGRWERAIHTFTRGNTAKTVTTHVGSTRNQAPEAMPMTYGWPVGIMPNIDAIANWLVRKGTPGSMTSPDIRISAATGRRYVRRGAGGFSGVAASATLMHNAIRVALQIRNIGFTFNKGQGGGQRLNTFRQAFENKETAVRWTIGRFIRDPGAHL